MVTTYYLEMRNPAQANLSELPANTELIKLSGSDAGFNRDFYIAVGEPWGWTDKADWSLAQWQRYVQGHGHELAKDPVETIHTWVLQAQGTQVGYFELALTEVEGAGVEVEVRYFGVLPAAIGQGYGAGLLSAAIEQAWALDASRVWVHTCSLDHPAALANYKKRGFELYHTETESL